VGEVNKDFSGEIAPDGTLQGKFSVKGFPPSMFSLRTKLDNWNGTYV
jgi:hypothetical protein